MKYLISVLLFIITFESYSQSNKDFSTNKMVISEVFVFSERDKEYATEIDALELLPLPIEQNFFHTLRTFSIQIDANTQTNFKDGINRLKFYIINNSDSNVSIPVINHQLIVVAEVKYNNKWHPIEYLLNLSCGYSYSNKILKSGTYWNVYVKKYSGKIKTQLRYKLKCGNMIFYSNQISSSFNIGQLKYGIPPIETEFLKF